MDILDQIWKSEHKKSRLTKRSIEEIDQLVADVISGGAQYRVEKMGNRMREIVSMAVEAEGERRAQFIADYQQKVDSSFEQKGKRLYLHFLRFLVWGFILLALMGIACIGKAVYLYLIK